MSARNIFTRRSLSTTLAPLTKHKTHRPPLNQQPAVSQPLTQRCQQRAMASSSASLPSPPYTPKKGAVAETPTTNPTTGLPFWNTHVPPHLRTKECPPFLRYAFKDDRDRACLLTADSDYTPTSWPAVHELIRTNQLEGFRRVPSQLHRYREWCAGIVDRHGSIMKFVKSKRLHWPDLTRSGAAPFENPDDYKILLNDWPYGIDPRIVHIVVWTKFDLEAEPVTAEKPKGDLTDKARREIDEFVQKTFGNRCGRENVIWFRNWKVLQSVPAVHHFHVMILEPEKAFVDEVTGGDVAMAELVGMPGETAKTGSPK